MKLTQGEKVALVAAFGAVILTALVHIVIREWYQPDIRYQEGGYYTTGGNAVTSLKLSNMGHSTAEKIIVIASFQDKLTDVSVANSSISKKVIGGGGGKTSRMNGYHLDDVTKIALGMDSVIGIELKKQVFGQIGSFSKPATK